MIMREGYSDDHIQACLQWEKAHTDQHRWKHNDKMTQGGQESPFDETKFSKITVQGITFNWPNLGVPASLAMLQCKAVRATAGTVCLQRLNCRSLKSAVP